MRARSANPHRFDNTATLYWYSIYKQINEKLLADRLAGTCVRARCQSLPDCPKKHLCGSAARLPLLVIQVGYHSSDAHKSTNVSTLFCASRRARRYMSVDCDWPSLEVRDQISAKTPRLSRDRYDEWRRPVERPSEDTLPVCLVPSRPSPRACVRAACVRRGKLQHSGGKILPDGALRSGTSCCSSISLTSLSLILTPSSLRALPTSLT